MGLSIIQHQIYLPVLNSSNQYDTVYALLSFRPWFLLAESNNTLCRVEVKVSVCNKSQFRSVKPHIFVCLFVCLFFLELLCYHASEDPAV